MTHFRKRFWLCALFTFPLPAFSETPAEVPHLNAFSPLALLGKWHTPCQTVTASGNTIWQKKTMTVTEDSITTLLRSYVDANCHIPHSTVTVRSSYKLSAASTSTVSQIDMTLTSLTMRYQNASDISALNSAGFAGYNDWKVNVPKDISGKSGTASEVGAITLGLTAMAGPTLYLTGASREHGRPTFIDTSTVWTAL